MKSRFALFTVPPDENLTEKDTLGDSDVNSLTVCVVFIITLPDAGIDSMLSSGVSSSLLPLTEKDSKPPFPPVILAANAVFTFIGEPVI